MSRTILLVEDEENDAFFFQSALARVGIEHPSRVVRDGQEAINYLEGKGRFANREEFPFPFLVFLDLKLPRVMGLDVLKWIRARLENAPVVLILTASDVEEDVLQAHRLGANGFLVKPTDLAELGNMLSVVCNYWLRYNILPARVK